MYPPLENTCFNMGDKTTSDLSTKFPCPDISLSSFFNKENCAPDKI